VDDIKEFIHNFYLILNVAVGVRLFGKPEETSLFPQTVLMD
jgi:hypothetical protein